MRIFYTKEHEYIQIDGDTGTIGISDHAQDQLGDVVFVELPEVGKSFKAGEPVAVVESVKAASDIYAPVAGTVTAVNAALNAEPSLVNEDAGGRGWFFKIKISNPSEAETLLSANAYADYLNSVA